MSEVKGAGRPATPETERKGKSTQKSTVKFTTIGSVAQTPLPTGQHGAASVNGTAHGP